MPFTIEENKQLIFGNGRIKVVLGEETYSVCSGTNTNRDMVCGAYKDLASVQQGKAHIEKTKKDNSTYQATVGTSHLTFYGKNGQVIGRIDCNAAPHAAKVVAYFYVKLNLGTVKDVESSFDADPSKKPPKKPVTERKEKSAPTTTSSSSSSEKKNKKSKKSKKPAPPPEESDSDSEPDLASSDEE